MELSLTARVVAVVILFAASGCPRSPGTSSPAVQTPAIRTPSDPGVTKLARILRAADRRLVDDDVRAMLADTDPALRAKAVLALGQIGDPSVLGRVINKGLVHDGRAIERAALAVLDVLAHRPD